MAKFEVGQRVKVNGNPYWLGEGTVRALYETNVSVKMLTGKMSGEIGAFGPSGLEPIVTFQPGDIVRAEKGDEIIQGSIYPPYDDGVLCLNVIEESYYLDYLTDERGYTLTLVKRPKPEIVLPTKPGMYFIPQNKRVRDEKWHTDGKIFFYLNTDGMWIDLGWGSPSVNDGQLKAYVNE